MIVWSNKEDQTMNQIKLDLSSIQTSARSRISFYKRQNFEDFSQNSSKIATHSNSFVNKLDDKKPKHNFIFTPNCKNSWKHSKTIFDGM